MDIQIGDKIKELRKARKITQEQLADAIGISFQAVSKWENHIALPDITLVPALANYFNVTCDELLGVRLMEKKEKIDSICEQSAKYRECDPEKSRMILEQGLKEYPDDDLLLNNLHEDFHRAASFFCKYLEDFLLVFSELLPHNERYLN